MKYFLGELLKIFKKILNIVLTYLIFLNNKRNIIFGRIFFLLDHPWVSGWDLKSTVESHVLRKYVNKLNKTS